MIGGISWSRKSVADGVPDAVRSPDSSSSRRSKKLGATRTSPALVHPGLGGCWVPSSPARRCAVATGGRGEAPTGAIKGPGRRHRVVLAGYCEDCGRPMALVFTQHKGQTLVEWSDEATWFDDDPSDDAF